MSFVINATTTRKAQSTYNMNVRPNISTELWDSYPSSPNYSGRVYCSNFYFKSSNEKTYETLNQSNISKVTIGTRKLLMTWTLAGIGTFISGKLTTIDRL